MRDWSAPALPAGWTTSGQPPFVARHEEVAALDAAWNDAVVGAGRAVFVSGEAGSGKSRLVSEVCTRFRATGAAVLTGSCIQELAASFEPFDEPLRALVPSFRDGAITASDIESGELLERVLDRTGSDAADRSIGQERVFAAVVDVVRAAAAVRPIVLALDDLHWAGPAAVRLLGRVVEGTVDARVLLLGTLRNSAPDRSDALAESLATLARLTGVQRIELAPFTAEEIADYVMIRAGVSRAGARDSAEMLGELTGGNPFLLRELWRRVVDAEPRDGRRVIELPDSAGDLVRARFATLDAAQRAVLQLAAVLGQEVDLGELIGISENSVDVTLQAMDAAALAGLIESPLRAGDHFRFPHAIARQAIIELIPNAELLLSHARIAQALEAKFPAAPRLVQRLAHHYTAARALGFGDRAVTYLMRAADLAEGRFAHEDAGRLFEHAAEISLDANERAELLLRAAGNWDLAADTERSRAICEQVIATGTPRLRLRAAIRFEDASWRPGLPGHRALDLLSAALATIPPDEHDPLYIEALASLARATAFTGDVDGGERLGDRALVLARADGDAQLLAATLRATTTMTLRPQDLPKRLERTSELTRLLRPTGMEWIGAGALWHAGNSYISGERAGMDDAERDLVEVERRWGPHWQYWSACVRFGRAFIAGAFDEAATACRRAQASEVVFRGDATASASAVQSYMVRRERGAIERMRPLITGEESPAERWAPGLLAIYTELGLTDPTQRLLDWLIERSGPDDSDSSDWPARLAFMAEAAVRLGDVGSAERLHPWLEEYTGLNLMSGMFVALFGSADCVLGEIESVCGTGSPGERFDAALDLAERTGAPLHVAHTLAAHAMHLRRTDPGSSAARALAERARVIAEPAGMVRVLRSLDGDAAASALGSRHGLTAREVQVIGLIAEGSSNRDIAVRLVISEHTAANHVRNILTKLGAANRTQAAMYAREQGLS